MKLHFVYAFNPDNEVIQAPHSITRNLYKFLSARIETKYYHWDSTVVPEIAPDDVVLGHPNYDKNTVIQQIFRRNIQCTARCLIHPFHHRRVDDNFPFDFMARQSSKIFAICGPYWYDTIEDSAFSRWKDRMVRLDMAVDKDHFPFLRQESGELAFNPPGHRRLVYIGGGTPHKNLGYLTEIMGRMPDVRLHWYGGPADHPLSKLPNVSSTPWAALTGEVVRKMVADHDIMVNVSVSDANPTTLLESRAWGLITACTKESGYYNDKFFTELYLEDIDKTIAAIRELLVAPTQDLYQRAVASRLEVENKYTWQNFCNKVWKELSALWLNK